MGPNKSNSPLPNTGDLPDFTTPETPQEFTSEELQVAQITADKGWEKVKEFAEERIEYYRQHLPGGAKISDVNKDELAAWVRAADTIITEFRGLITEIEGVSNAVKESKRR